MRPATVNWVESLAAPLPLFFHCSSFSLRIFILSARDILGSGSTLDLCWIHVKHPLNTMVFTKYTLTQMQRFA